MGIALSKEISTVPRINEKSNHLEPRHDTVESLSGSLQNLSVSAVPLSSDGSLSVGNLEEWEKEVSQVRRCTV
jgi:uncharacterized protein YoxC